jgi:streptogramin lyase
MEVSGLLARASNKVGRISPNGSITEFPLATANGQPDGITAGPDRNMWFTEANGDRIGRITPSGQLTEFPVNGSPSGITGGSDGNLWFTESQANRIGKISTNGQVTEFPIPTEDSQPRGIANGPDFNMWFTESNSETLNGRGKIGRITPSGKITEFQLSPDFSATAAITSGPDGNLWFTEGGGSRIGRITPSGKITEFPIPGNEIYPGYYGGGITSGPDGNLWFVASTLIGRITPTGEITEFSAPTNLTAITAGPDGNIWFTGWTLTFNSDALIGNIAPGALGANVESSRAKVSHGKVKLEVVCVGGNGVCHGTVRLGYLQRGKRAGPTTFARSRFSVYSGKSKCVALELTRSALRMLGHRRQLRASVTVGVRGGLAETGEVVLNS